MVILIVRLSLAMKYLVVGGCGLIIYNLKEPFNQYNPFGDSDQYTEFFREPENIWWITKLRQPENNTDGKIFQFEAMNDESVFIYEMNATDFSIKKKV